MLKRPPLRRWCHRALLKLVLLNLTCLRIKLLPSFASAGLDGRYSAKDAYPISGLTFLLVPKEGKNTEKTKEVKEFINYIITQGQNQAEALFYAKLPNTLQQQDENLLSQVGAGGQQNQAFLR